MNKVHAGGYFEGEQGLVEEFEFDYEKYLQFHGDLLYYGTFCNPCIVLQLICLPSYVCAKQNLKVLLLKDLIYF